MPYEWRFVVQHSISFFVILGMQINLSTNTKSAYRIPAILRDGAVLYVILHSPGEVSMECCTCDLANSTRHLHHQLPCNTRPLLKLTTTRSFRLHPCPAMRKHP